MKDNERQLYRNIGQMTHEQKTKYILRVRETAKMYLDSGLAVLPIYYRDKKPKVKSWKEYQNRPPKWEGIARYFDNLSNIAIICGVASGGLAVFDFDDMSIYQMFRDHHPEIEDTRIAKTSKGMHVYYRVEGGTINTHKIGKVDIKAQGGYVVAPPSVHPSGTVYMWQNQNSIKAISLEKWETFYQTILRLNKKTNIAPPEGQTLVTPPPGRKLGMAEINEIVSLLSPAYIPGYRDYIVMYLSGWLYKSGVDNESAKRIIETLAEKDAEKRDRLIVLHRTYRNITPDKAKGKSGLQEVLTDVFREKLAPGKEAEEMAVTIMAKVQEIIGEPSPWKDAIAALLNYQTRLYAVINPRKRGIFLATWNNKENRLKLHTRITAGMPKNLVVRYNALNRSSVTFEFDFIDLAGRVTHYGPANLVDITRQLKANGFIINSRYAQDAIAAIINTMMEKGKTEIREGTDAAGFFIINGEIHLSGEDYPTEVDTEELREALELLDELIMKWFKGTEQKTAMIFKFGIVAPFSYIKKQHFPNQYMPWLYLYGRTQTGKTHRGEIITHIWGRSPQEQVIPYTKIDTLARMGRVLSKSTFPFIIREFGNVLLNEDLVDTLKLAIESTTVRGRYNRNMVYEEFPALAPLFITSNRARPKDPALLERIILFTFTPDEQFSGNQKEKYHKEVSPRLPHLSAIGRAVALYVKAKYKKSGIEYFKKPWEEMAKEILRDLYRAVKLDPPIWINYTYEEEVLYDDDITDRLRASFLEEINKAYRYLERSEKAMEVLTEGGTQSIMTMGDYYDSAYDALKQKVIKVFGGYKIPWGVLRTKDNDVYITIYKSIMPYLPRDIKEFLQEDFKQFVSFLNYIHLTDMGTTQPFKIPKRMGSDRRMERGVLIPLGAFMDFIRREQPKTQLDLSKFGGDDHED